MTGLSPDIKDDVAFITGATSGLGYVLAKELVARGARVIITGRREAACQDVASELNSEAGKTVAVAAKLDTTSWDEHLVAYELGKQAFGRVDYFFANAGVVESMWIPKFEADRFDAAKPFEKPNFETAEVNYLGQLNTAGLALQVFQSQSLNRHGFRGKLVMMSSIFGLFPSVTMPMYCSSKSGILAFVRSTSELYKDKNITINCICPNVSPTKILPPDVIEHIGKQNLLTPIDFVIEQYISILGASKDNGKAIGVFKDDAWDHPLDTFKRDENRAAYRLIDENVGRIFGYWA